MKFFLFFVFVCCIALKAHSQVYFETSFGGTANDYARSVRQLSDGSIYVAGYSNGGTHGGFDYSLNKLDRWGNLLWTKYYGDTLDNNGLYMNTTSDGFIFTGETQTPANGLDIRLCKIDTAGNLLWTQQYGGTANESGKYVTQTSDGGFILCGFKSDALGTNDSYVIKTDSDGNLQWDRSLGGTSNDYSDMVRETPEGDFIVTADTKSKGSGGYDIEVIKLNSAGTVLWDSTYGDTLNQGCQGILITSKNKYLSYGEGEVYKYSPFDFILQLIDTDGTLLWNKTFGGTNTDAIFSAVETTDGGFMLTGYSNSYSPGPLDVVVMKTDSSGNLKWVQHYGDIGIDIGYEIVSSIYNGYLICGKTYTNSDDCYLLHLDSTGMVTGIKQQPEKFFYPKIFPDPCRNEFSISGFPYPAQLEIQNSLGEKVFTATLSNEEEIIRLNKPSGIYFYRLTNGKGEIASGKLAIE